MGSGPSARSRHRRLASALVVVLLSVGAVDAQTTATPSTTPDTSRSIGRQDLVQTSQSALIQHDVVAPPSSDFTPYVEGELVRVSIPSNWRKLPGSNAVTFAPEGAYGNVGAKSVFTHGLGMGLARNDKRNLRITTDDFIQSHVLAAPNPGRPFRHGRVTIGARPGLHTVLSRVSEATGELERIEIFTTLLRDGTLFYVLAVTPRDGALNYASTFRRIVGSIELLDCDGCVR